MPTIHSVLHGFNPVFELSKQDIISILGIFEIRYERIHLKISEYAWVKNFSMLYIDNPVGTGFSFTDDIEGYSTNFDSVANNLYNFLEQFFTLFSEFRERQVYIAGQSAAGYYLSVLGPKIMNSKKSIFNFAGIAVGNPWLDPSNQLKYTNLLKSIGFIDEKQMIQIEQDQDKIRDLILAKNYTQAFSKFEEISKFVFELNIILQCLVT